MSRPLFSENYFDTLNNDAPFKALQCAFKMSLTLWYFVFQYNNILTF